MASFLRIARHFLRAPLQPHQYPTTGFQRLDNSLTVEEERESLYAPATFYPAKIGEILHSRYQIVGKLGYGGYSTIWLCRDLIERNYVTLKLCRSDTPNIRREIDMYSYLNKVIVKHPGAALVRKMLNSFEIRDKENIYPCIIHTPLGMSLAKFRSRLPDKKLPEHILKLTLIHILIALEFLHSKARIIHCDLQEKNVLLGIEDTSILEAFDKQEQENPTPRKIEDGRIIYASRDLDSTTNPGRPVLTDFGEARSKGSTHTGLIQPAQYRAPEVLLKMPWNYKVDIWNVGVMIWDLFQDNNMFNVKNPNKKLSMEHHLAEIVAYLGCPSANFVKGNDIALKYFNADGSWKGIVEVPKSSLEESEHNLEGQNKALFLTFMRKMLKWDPEERSCARELLADTWLRDGDHFASDV